MADKGKQKSYSVKGAAEAETVESHSVQGDTEADRMKSGVTNNPSKQPENEPTETVDLQEKSPETVRNPTQSKEELAESTGIEDSVRLIEGAEGKEVTEKPVEAVKEVKEKTKEVQNDRPEGSEISEDTKQKSDETPEKTKPSEQNDDEESEDEGIEEISTTEELDRSARDALYERGNQYETKHKKNLALKCFLQCLKGLDDATQFSFLPQCLRKIADIYFEKEELEKAIQFIQAEKIFYETALIDTSELARKLEDRKSEQSGEDNKPGEDPKAATPEIVRADEYEKLAKICLKQSQAQLALEYQGKATKLRQQIYGNDHAVTTKSLDFFTVIYGEVGKQQYSESMQKLSKPLAEDALESPQSILRKRKKNDEEKDTEEDSEAKEKEKRVRFAESQMSREQEEWISQKLLLLLFLFSVVVCGVLVFYIYCKTHTRSESCAYWKTEIFYCYMRIKYAYHYYFVAGNQVVG